MRRRPEAVAAAVLFVLLTGVMTWPLAAHPASLAPQHHDVYFNMWRLRWIAHAIAAAPRHLFDGNIFYPETGVLALSDAVLLEGVVSAPLLWAKLNPVAVQNVMILAPIALSGAAMFLLARHLTGSRGAGVLAGIAFAFAPYRFEHLQHLELQWTIWTPLSFLALHRLLETGKLKWGVALGSCMALQLLSCMYYGIFLATLLPLGALMLAACTPAVRWRPVTTALAAAAAVALAGSLVYSRPFVRAHEVVGDRPLEDVESFSAKPADYLVAPTGNQVYGRATHPGAPERRLFPGGTIAVLALVGVLFNRSRPVTAIYLLLLAAAFEGSLGLGGYSYAFLHAHVPAFRSLRAMARLGIFVVMFLSVLGAYGFAAAVSNRSSRIRVTAACVLAAMMLLEYRTRVVLAPFVSSAPPLYRMLAGQPRGVVAEFPVPRQDRLPEHDAEYAYLSTFHWFPLVNGYSGNYPRSYLDRIERLHGFPDGRALEQLKRDGVRYVVVHRFGYGEGDIERTRTRLIESGTAELLGEFADGDTTGLLFAIR